MLLVVDSNGTVLSAATIVWGPSVVATHRGNNVWRVSNLLPASEVDELATVIFSVTKERTVIRSVTKPVTSFLTRTNTQQPWVTQNVTATVTNIQWVTVGSIIGGTRTHTHVLGTNTLTRTQETTRPFTRSVSRPATVEATATKTVTKVVTVTAPAYDCCCDCTWSASGAGQIPRLCSTAAACTDPRCDLDTGDCLYDETVKQRIGDLGKHTGVDCDDQGAGLRVVYDYNGSNDCVAA